MLELNLSLRQLHYFVVTARHGSLRRAALELKIRQPSLGAQIKVLEEALDVTLFERSRGGVTLTPLGRELLPEAQAALDAARHIVETAASAMGGPKGTYRLGVSRSLGPYALPYVLPELHKRYPDVKFFVREGVPDELARGLANAQHDLIFTTMPVDDPGLTVVPLFREPICLVMNASHHLAKKEKLTARSLQGEDILTIEEHHLFFRQVEDLAKRFRARLLRDYEGTSLDAIRQMVYMEMGIAFLPALYVRSEISKRDNLRVAEVPGSPIYRVHALVWRDRSPQRHFYRQCAEVFRAVAGRAFGKDATPV